MRSPLFMEPQFKSSFIPKKPVSPVSMRQMKSRPMGLLFVLSAVIFAAAVAMAGGIFGYGEYLKQDIAKKSAELEVARRDLQPALIEEIRRLDARIRHANTLLSNHLALSPLFSLLEESTLFNVQFTDFSYVFNPEGGVTLKLKGLVPSFASLALQSDVIYRNPTFSRVAFSAVNLDEEGNVLFDLALDVDSAVIAYRNLLEASEGMMQSLPQEVVGTSTPENLGATTTNP